MDKKKKNRFLRILLVVFIIYLGLLIASESGYYEKRINKETIFTAEAIKQFEKDVADGKNVDVNTYLKNDNRNYANVFTKAGEKVSDVMRKVLTDGIGNTIDIFKSLFL